MHPQDTLYNQTSLYRKPCVLVSGLDAGRIKEDEDTSGPYLQQASSLGQFSQIHGPGGKKNEYKD